MKSKIIQYILFAVCGFCILGGCTKIIDVATPQNQLTTDKVFADTTSAKAAMVNIYALFDKTIDPNYNKWLELYTDNFDFLSSGTAQLEFYQSNLSVTNSTVKAMWANYYFVIYSCNDMLVQLQNSTGIPVAMKNSFGAEAKFLRAYANYYLVNCFGKIPLIVTTDVNQTAKIAQSDSISVYKQIMQDLGDAQNSLSVTYAGGGRVRANKWAATALLARIYLTQHDWVNAEAAATAVINSGLYTPLLGPGNVFLANSKESILQFCTQNGFITDAASLIPATGTPGYAASQSLLSAFENGDLRKTNWLKSSVVSAVTYYYPFKYHNRTTNSSTPEYLTALRVAEEYLIRAEARAQQGNISGAVNDLNTLKARARNLPTDMPDYSATISQADCLNKVAHEWRVEFFAEWGHRFLDLKRFGSLNSVMSAYRSTWQNKAILLPIPSTEITADDDLHQNAGY
jgi:hypothetical protein